MAAITAQDSNIIQEQIDSIDSQINHCKKSIEGKAENRSNSIEWYQQEIRTLTGIKENLQGMLNSGMIPDPPAGVIPESEDLQQELAEIKKGLPRVYEAFDKRITELEQRVDKLENPAPPVVTPPAGS